MEWIHSLAIKSQGFEKWIPFFSILIAAASLLLAAFSSALTFLSFWKSHKWNKFQKETMENDRTAQKKYQRKQEQIMLDEKAFREENQREQRLMFKGEQTYRIECQRQETINRVRDRYLSLKDSLKTSGLNGFLSAGAESLSSEDIQSLAEELNGYGGGGHTHTIY